MADYIPGLAPKNDIVFHTIDDEEQFHGVACYITSCGARIAKAVPKKESADVDMEKICKLCSSSAEKRRSLKATLKKLDSKAARK